MLLPAPLAPTMPIRSPVLIRRLMSCKAQNSDDRHGRLAAQHQVEHRPLERVLLVGVADEPERDVAQLDQRVGRPERRRLATAVRAAQSRKTSLSSCDLNAA